MLAAKRMFESQLPGRLSANGNWRPFFARRAAERVASRWPTPATRFPNPTAFTGEVTREVLLWIFRLYANADAMTIFYCLAAEPRGLRSPSPPDTFPIIVSNAMTRPKQPLWKLAFACKSLSTSDRFVFPSQRFKATESLYVCDCKSVRRSPLAVAVATQSTFLKVSGFDLSLQDLSNLRLIKTKWKKQPKNFHFHRTFIVMKDAPKGAIVNI